MYRKGDVLRFKYRDKEYIGTVRVIHKIDGNLSYDLYNGKSKTLFKNVPEEAIIEEQYKSVGLGDKPNISVFGKNEKYWHICECCGKKELLTSKEGFDKGWDYCGPNSMYPESQFGVVSPRTCGDCGIMETAYAAITIYNIPKEKLSEKHKKTILRILQEPEIYRVKH